MDFVTEITLTERGDSLILDAATASIGPLADAIAFLARRAILGTAMSGEHRIVTPRQFVGRLSAPGASIAVVPKDPDFFRQIHGFIGSAAGKEVPTPDAGESGPKSLLSLVSAFLSTLETAAARGLPVVYRRAQREGSRPTGALRIHDTIQRFAARGVRHVAVFDVPFREYDPDLRAILATATDVLRVSSQLRALAVDDLLRLQLLLDGIGADVPPLDLAESLSLLDRILGRYADWPELLNLLAVCETIIRRDVDVTELDAAAPGGRSHFYDMDRLWELVVFHAYKGATGDLSGYSVALHPLRGTETRLFTNGGPDLDPDVIVYDGDEVVAVVDAKYSDAMTASASDVYQLTAYVGRLEARIGVLCYMTSGESWVIELGHTVDGAAMFAAGISASDVATTGVAVAEATCGTAS